MVKLKWAHCETRRHFDKEKTEITEMIGAFAATSDCLDAPLERSADGKITCE